MPLSIKNILFAGKKMYIWRAVKNNCVPHFLSLYLVDEGAKSIYLAPQVGYMDYLSMFLLKTCLYFSDKCICVVHNSEENYIYFKPQNFIFRLRIRGNVSPHPSYLSKGRFLTVSGKSTGLITKQTKQNIA